MKLITFVIPVVLVLVIGALVVSYSSPSEKDNIETENTQNTTIESYQDVTAEEFISIIETSDPFVIDTHIPEQEHIAGTDVFIPYTDIEVNIADLPTNKDAEILVYCRSGNMSQTASQTLVDLGYTNVKNLVGGKIAYDAYVQKNQQGVTITPANQDLGTVIYGDVPETNFVILNNTDQEIALTRVTTSCGCTQAFPEKDTVQSGESIDMRVTFDPAVHGDATDVGDLTRTIYVETDHPNYPRLENTISATVILND